MPSNILKQCYDAYAYPHLSYCIALYGNTYPTVLQPLFVLQKKIVRIVGKTEPLDHTKPIFKEFKIIPLYDLVELETCVFMFKNQANFQFAAHDYQTRYHDAFQLPFPHLSLYQRSLNYIGPKLWNKLSQEIKSAPNISIFKNRLKKSLLNSI